MSKLFNTGLFLFSNDLRIQDNPPLEKAMQQCSSLLLLSLIDDADLKPGRFGLEAIGDLRLKFLIESLQALRVELGLYKLDLHVLSGGALELLHSILQEHAIEALYFSEQSGLTLQQVEILKSRLDRNVKFVPQESALLFDPLQLPFEVNDLPVTFSQFRKVVEGIVVTPPLYNTFTQLPKSIVLAQKFQRFHRNLDVLSLSLETAEPNSQIPTGGSLAARLHFEHYFSTTSPSTYKETRNALDGWHNSTKFSYWLANGSVSPRTLWYQVLAYEDDCLKNDSTQWILFELLWREYFHLYSQKHGEKLYAFQGISQVPPLTTFYPYRFALWCNGHTPYPIVNACMNQLKTIGYISNRGRQLVASCFVHELGLDWRYGAAFFQKHLIDYDAASNWGNWQYLAGVGADPRGHRHFNLEKQTQAYDPNGEFIKCWHGKEKMLSIDNVDMVDWPLE